MRNCQQVTSRPSAARPGSVPPPGAAADTERRPGRGRRCPRQGSRQPLQSLSPGAPAGLPRPAPQTRDLPPRPAWHTAAPQRPLTGRATAARLGTHTLTAAPHGTPAGARPETPSTPQRSFRSRALRREKTSKLLEMQTRAPPPCGGAPPPSAQLPTPCVTPFRGSAGRAGRPREVPAPACALCVRRSSYGREQSRSAGAGAASPAPWCGPGGVCF